MKNSIYCNIILTGHANPIRCRSCAQKINKQGVQHSQETKKKMSLAKLGQNHWNYKDGRTNRKYYCQDCEVKISRQAGAYGTRCCKSCAMKNREIPFSTRVNISLSHGGTGIPYELTEYGIEFDDVLKEQVRFRDKYKCQICGCSQLENGRQLDCHHIDYKKKNSVLNNLIALCMSCHTKTNTNRNYWYNILKLKIKG